MHGFATKENVCEDGDEVGDVVDCSAGAGQYYGGLSLDVSGVVGSDGGCVHSRTHHRVECGAGTKVDTA